MDRKHSGMPQADASPLAASSLGALTSLGLAESIRVDASSATTASAGVLQPSDAQSIAPTSRAV